MIRQISNKDNSKDLFKYIELRTDRLKGTTEVENELNDNYYVHLKNKRLQCKTILKNH